MKLDIYFTLNDYEKVCELYEKCKDNAADIYVNMINCYAEVSLEDCYKTMVILQEQTRLIKSYNLSPFETVMFVYDLVRRREYNEEKDGNKLSSRNLVDVVLGDKIVCAGYSNLICTLLEMQGIDCSLQFLESNNSKHVINKIQLDDELYNISGEFFLDATVDSKNNNSYYYLNSYKFFMQNRNYMKKYENYKYEYLYENDFCKLDYFRIEYLLNNNMYTIIYAEYIDVFSKIKEPFDGKKLLAQLMIKGYDDDFKKTFLHLLKENLFKNNLIIDASIYISALNKVRKIENSIDPEEYSYSLEDLYNCYEYSNWLFDDSLSVIEKIFDPTKEINIMSKRELFDNYITNSGIKNEFESMKREGIKR